LRHPPLLCARFDLPKTDAELILNHIGGHEGDITTLIVGLILDNVCGISAVPAGALVAPGSLQLPLYEPIVDLSTSPSLEGSYLLALQFAGWLRLRPKVAVLTVSPSQLTMRGRMILQRSIEQGLLPELMEVHVADDHDGLMRDLPLAAADAMSQLRRRRQTALGAPVVPPLGAGAQLGRVLSAEWPQNLKEDSDSDGGPVSAGRASYVGQRHSVGDLGSPAAAIDIFQDAPGSGHSTPRGETEEQMFAVNKKSRIALRIGKLSLGGQQRSTKLPMYSSALAPSESAAVATCSSTSSSSAMGTPRLSSTDDIDRL